MHVTIVGGGLAGTECAWQLAERGVGVTLVEQKPQKRTAAQRSDGLAELVCSNSFRGNALTNAVGLLKEEMRRSGSLILASAEVAKVPAGGALAVDRELFSREVTGRVEAHPGIERVHREVTCIPDERPLVLATGPLTGSDLADDLAARVGESHLAYYDAIAPVVSVDSIVWERVFRASRYDKGGDAAYINCPMDEAQYHAFVEAVIGAEKVTPRSFEEVRYFEGCLPIEVMAERGVETLAHGPMKPVGLSDPRTGTMPHAVVQLRQEDMAATEYNLVGFQTRMTWPEQKRVLRMIPGLEEAEFARLGSIHRNTFVNAPACLGPELELRALSGVHLAGQITGVEGYVESAACGLSLGVMLADKLSGNPVEPPPPSTALGALLVHLQTPRDSFQPSNVLWSMFPPLENPIRGPRRGRKRRRHEALAERALADLEPWLDRVGARPVRTRAWGDLPSPTEGMPSREVPA